MHLMDILIVTKVPHKLQKLVIHLMDILIVKHVHGELKQTGHISNGYFNNETCSWCTKKMNDTFNE